MRTESQEQEQPSRLLIVSGPGEGNVIPLEFQGRGVIGRSSTCEVVLKDLSVSRRHAELRRTPSGRWRIRDMGSRNGITVNEESGPGWMVVENGSIITIGDIVLRFETGQEGAGANEDRYPPRKRTRIEEQADHPSTRKRSEKPARKKTSSPQSERKEKKRSVKGGLPPRKKPSPSGDHTAVVDRSKEIASIINEPKKITPHYVLGTFIGLAISGLLAAIIIFFLGYDRPADRTTPHPLPTLSEEKIIPPEPESPPEPVVQITPEMLTRAGTLITVAREAIAEERWSEAEKNLRNSLEIDPSSTEARNLMELISRETEALAILKAAYDAYEIDNHDEALMLAEAVDPSSRYNRIASLMIRNIENGEEPPPRPGIQEAPGIAEPEPEPEPEVKKAAPTPRKKAATTKRPVRRRAPARKARASSGPHQSIVMATDAFSQGNVSDARALAESAADANISGARTLQSRLNDYHRSYEAGKSAQNQGNVVRALADYTAAYTTATQISPPRGGTPGANLSRTLADLHFRQAETLVAANDRASAMAQLNRALQYQPNHSRAKELAERLQSGQ